MKSPTAIVIGAGIGGIATAAHLARRGFLISPRAGEASLRPLYPREGLSRNLSNEAKRSLPCMPYVDSESPRRRIHRAESRRRGEERDRSRGAVRHLAPAHRCVGARSPGEALP